MKSFVPTVIAFGMKTIKPGETASLTAFSQINVLPRWLVIPSKGYQGLVVKSIRQGQRHLIPSLGEIPVRVFRETLTERNRIQLDWENLIPSSGVTVDIENKSLLEMICAAHLLCIAEVDKPDYKSAYPKVETNSSSNLKAYWVGGKNMRSAYESMQKRYYQMNAAYGKTTKNCLNCGALWVFDSAVSGTQAGYLLSNHCCNEPRFK